MVWAKARSAFFYTQTLASVRGAVLSPRVAAAPPHSGFAGMVWTQARSACVHTIPQSQRGPQARAWPFCREWRAPLQLYTFVS